MQRTLCLLSLGLALCQPARAEVEVAGASLDADGSTVTFGYGGAMTNQRYQAGSISKFSCAIAAVTLEQQGKLSLDDSVSTLLPDYQGASKEVLTLRQLLANRSGLENSIMQAVRSDRTLIHARYSALEAANLFAVKSKKSPGQEFDYVNSNWILVQAILEQQSSKPLAELIAELVLVPAGMQHSNIFTGSIIGQHVPTVQGNSMPVPGFISCAGGLAATPADLLRLLRYAAEDSRLNAQSRAELQLVLSPEQHYALGGRLRSARDSKGNTHSLSWQDGQNGAWNAKAIYDLYSHQGIALMSAADDAGDQRLTELSQAWLQQQGLTLTD